MNTNKQWCLIYFSYFISILYWQSRKCTSKWNNWKLFLILLIFIEIAHYDMNIWILWNITKLSQGVNKVMKAILYIFWIIMIIVNVLMWNVGWWVICRVVIIFHYIISLGIIINVIAMGEFRIVLTPIFSFHILIVIPGIQMIWVIRIFHVMWMILNAFRGIKRLVLRKIWGC